jgi:hypothetical protein
MERRHDRSRVIPDEDLLQHAGDDVEAFAAMRRP